MTLTAVDHALAFLLAVAVPLWGVREWQTLVRSVESGDPDARLREYRNTILLEWGLVALIVAWWLLAGRSLASLGFQLPLDKRLAWGLALVVGALAGLWFQWRSIDRLDADGLAQLRAQVAPVATLLPHTERERQRFRWLALTAGTAEEIMYRGFLLWYGMALLGAWPGAVAVILAFAAGHAYQGVAGVIKTGVVGAILAGLYLLGGSLLWPMLLHVAIDLQGGALGYRVLGTRTD